MGACCGFQRPAREMAEFYNREMQKDGWAKDGASMELGLFFAKGPQVIGVLLNSAGGTFSSMGS